MPRDIGESADPLIVLPMNPLRVTIMSRHECHLCRVVERVVGQVQQDLPFELITVDIDSDERLRKQYSDRVPVLWINDRETFSGKVTAGELREAIKKARWRNPISRILSRVKLALTRG